MATHVVPTHRPHEQLRMEAPKQRDHTDKYVSTFVSGDSDVDMSFRNPVLPKSADHFKVGIDDFTANLSSLSMLEYGVDDVLFRVIRRGYQADLTAAAGGVAEVTLAEPYFQMHDGPAGNLNVWRDAFSFKVDKAYNTMLEVADRCTQIATAVGSYIRQEGLVNIAEDLGANPPVQEDNRWTLEFLDANNATLTADQRRDANTLEHFRMNITANGQLRFSGNKIFWANFAIQVPLEKYRQILFRSATKQYISVHPGTGSEIAVPYVHGAATITVPTLDPVWDGAYDPADQLGLEFVAEGNLLSTLDRRVTLEVGCSLPLKNSPMVDHGEEAPDFVLGRFMFHQPYTMKSFAPGGISGNPTPEILVPGLGARTLQGPRDRIVYHHLQAQQKIQILRLKLWARVRTYNAGTKKWGMKTIVCPVQDIDYWHIRLHFIEK